MNKIILLIFLNILLNIIIKKCKLPNNFSFVNLILTSTLTIYFSILLSGKNVDTTTKKEVINKEVAYLYPVILSISLLGFYFVIKKLKKSKDTIIPIFFYFSIMVNLCQLFKGNELIVCFIVILWLIFHLKSKGKYNNIKFYGDNILAILLCVASIKSVEILDFSTAVILLCGLFIFDIFWVFGSKKVFSESVMETVATNVNAPVMLKFNTNTDRGYMILGLGDIIIPAIFIKLLYKKTNIDKSYFNLSLITYSLGLIITLVANSLSKKGQPALLYLVPALILPTYIKAYMNNNLDKLYKN